MSGSLNKVILIGSIGKDPEVRSTPSGAKVANFSMATNERYTDKQGQKVDKTEWHKIVMWRGLADIAERYLKKGSQVCIEGKLQTRSWDDHDGQKRYTTEIKGESLQMLGGRSEGDNAYEPRPQFDSLPSVDVNTPTNGIPPEPEEDSLPF